MKIKVAITDDHPIVREGLKRILQKQKTMEVTNAYATGKHMLEHLALDQPDVLLLDIQLPDISGEALLPLIRKEYPNIRIVMLTSNESFYSIKMLLGLGANGYILKNSEMDLLVQAIKHVYEGGIFLSPQVQEKLNSLLIKSSNAITVTPELTKREIEILQLIAQEKSSKEIGTLLCIGYRTVENYRRVIMQKLGTKNMIGMVKQAIVLGLIKE